MTATVAEAVDVCVPRPEGLPLCLHLGLASELARSHVFDKAAHPVLPLYGSRVCPEVYILFIQDQAIGM